MRSIPSTSAFLIFMLGCLLAEEPVFRESDLVPGAMLIPERYHPALSALPDGSLVCAWSEGSGAQALDTSIKISRKASDSDNWSPPQPVTDDIGYADNYPELALLADGKLKLFFATLYNEKRKAQPDLDLDAWHLKYIESVDGGCRWGKPFFLIPESDLVPSGKPAALRNGALLVPLLDVRNKSARFIVSKDRGAYWQLLPQQEKFEGFICNGVVENELERLRAALSPIPDSGREKKIWFATSADSAVSWSVPDISDLFNPGGSVAVLNLENGHMIIAFNDHQLWMTPLTVAVSIDGGLSWRHKRNIDTGQWDNRDPGLAQSKDGLIHLVYISRNIHLKHVVFTESWLWDKR